MEEEMIYGRERGREREKVKYEESETTLNYVRCTTKLSASTKGLP